MSEKSLRPEAEDLADERETQPKMKFARKSGRVIIEEHFKGLRCTLTVSVSELEVATSCLADLSPSECFRFVDLLFEALLTAELASSKPKPRGIQAGRKAFLDRMKLLAALVFLFISQKRPDHFAPLTCAEEDLAHKVEGFKAYNPRDQRILLTA